MVAFANRAVTLLREEALENCKSDCKNERDSGTQQQSDRYTGCDSSCKDTYQSCKSDCQSQ